MIAPSEVREGAGQIGFPLTTLEGKKAQPKPVATHLDQDAAVARFEINLSGSQLLAGFATALCFMDVLLWALLKLWLF
jgi:hypothetical protein